MYKIVIATFLSLFFSFSAFSMQVFDMEEIRDPGTLQIKVLQDWHKVQGSHRNTAEAGHHQCG